MYSLTRLCLNLLRLLRTVQRLFLCLRTKGERQVEAGSKERAGSSECKQGREEHAEQCRAGWGMNPADPLTSSDWHLSAQTQDLQVCGWPGLYSTPASFACFCLSFAAKTSASLSPAGLHALFHFQFNRIDVARCSQDTWHCSVWLWQCLQQKGMGEGERGLPRSYFLQLWSHCASCFL